MAISTRTEEILVLYGSQTGNSEQAAIEICDTIPEKLSAEKIAEYTSGKDGEPTATSRIILSARHMQLDDFIELEEVRWTRLVIIVTSSYGVGQAPLGCYKFRDLCEAFIARYSKTTDNDDDKNKSDARNDTNGGGKVLDGITYAMLGLGDSKYTTFFENPTKIDTGMQLAGAKRVGPLGKADASGIGEDSQLDVIARWIDEIWLILAKVVVTDPPSKEKMVLVQERTAALCKELFLDPIPEKEDNDALVTTVLPFLVVLVAILAFAFVTKQ